MSEVTPYFLWIVSKARNSSVKKCYTTLTAEANLRGSLVRTEDPNIKSANEGPALMKADQGLAGMDSLVPTQRLGFTIVARP
jgi:hypothetical protein